MGLWYFVIGLVIGYLVGRSMAPTKRPSSPSVATAMSAPKPRRKAPARRRTTAKRKTAARSRSTTRRRRRR